MTTKAVANQQLTMIKSFRHKGIQQFFETGSKTGINAEQAPNLSRQLLLLNAA